jgi:hypothetical protein
LSFQNHQSMNKRRSFLFLFFLFIVFKSSSQDFQITLLKLEFYGNQLHIAYNIDNKTSIGKFRIDIKINKQNGDSITPKSITGDLGNNIKSGNNKSIIWDLEKDSIHLDENISIEIIGKKHIEALSKGSIILMSTAVPGLGQTKVSGKPWWLCSIAAYGTLASGFIIYKSSLNTYNLYKAENNPSTRTDQYNKAQKNLNIANTLFITSATLWVANIIWAAATPNSNQSLKHVKVYLEPVTIPNNAGAMVALRVDF